MRLFHRHRNKQKNPPQPTQEDLLSPFDSPAPSPPIRNFSYPTAALRPPSGPSISSSAQLGIHLPPAGFGEARTSTTSGLIEPPFYWASSYRPIREEEIEPSTDSQSFNSDTGPEAFIIESEGLPRINRSAPQNPDRDSLTGSRTTHPSAQAVFESSPKKASPQKRAFVLGHKFAKSVDLASTHLRPPSPLRPASSSGIATVDTRTAPHRIGLAIDEEDNHPGTLLDLSDDEMGLRRRISEMDLRMSPPKRMFSDHSQTSEYSASTVSVSGSPTKKRRSGKTKPKDGKHHWVSQLKDWFSTGEPSSQDWKQLKKQEYHKHGIAMNDPDASAKLHAPIGAIPEEAIKPSSGPDPETIAKKKFANRKQVRQAYGGCERISGSVSSESSAGSREVNPIAPWA
ncbi:hypothetical protein CABS01_04439 [Colletotrichum abscissum]|uniref:Uncharacterized protein n=1 Tax=Colletotrichum abscissum TaxID=1671311 RepID=A0A9P9XMM8_9PEZI|nr:uncharacterized protein CABS01_04439 [Colletotrichum abscissum]KAI3556303.1 hypothetical protein CABS02_03586 [Colletotrichum abscissum]KAK1473777.1 hypothetical protein CABS01_04439 [Colletotrichum abscissum]